MPRLDFRQGITTPLTGLKQEMSAVSEHFWGINFLSALARPGQEMFKVPGYGVKGDRGYCEI